jgi:tRNA/tmRNA/rRNA uracil-C5-methylase (TrmA/RlmC/RlmD family)
MKRAIVADAFRRIGKIDVDGLGLLEGPEAVGPEFGWRNRIRLSFDSAGRPGLLARGSHDVVPIETCLLPREDFRETFLPWMRMLPPWRKATLRFDGDGRSVLLLETADPANAKDRKRLGSLTKGMEPPPGLIGLIADGIPLAGRRDLRFRVRGTELRADATSFFQVNPDATERLVDVVEDSLGGERGALLDLYAGVGLFSACLGRDFERVTATEADPRAARHLKHNLKKVGVRGEARAEQAMVTLRMLPRSGNETVILDPPRAGLTPEARQALVERAPRRIVSVSCDPATGARDAGALVQAGWGLKRVTALDLFPVTAHVETVSLLVREDPSAGEETA